MEPPRRIELGYSLKNIPVPSETLYMKRLIEKVTSVITRMRWRAFHYLRGGKDNDNEDHAEENYGLSSRKSPPHVEELEAFEEDVEKLVENVAFRKYGDKFQNTLKKDIARMKRSKSVLVAADKTRNLYEVSTEQHEKLLRDNITKHYRAAAASAYDDINEEAQMVATKLGRNLAGRMDTMAEREAYVTLKDHKERFADNLPCRLINPAKSEIGLISKRIIDNINASIRAKAGVTIWRSSAAVIEWFRAIEDKGSCSFMCFDIVEFYPSITEKLLHTALTWAKGYADITELELEAIYHCRKSLLFSKGKAWTKAHGRGLFDVTMGSFDGAEVSELVGAFALAQLPERCRDGNAGLYRDDGLAVLKGMSGSEADRLRKEIVQRFLDLGLRLTIATNLKVTNFLDLTLNLTTGKYYPYRKPNDVPLYINRLSNHPPAILNQLPAAISRRLTDLSHDKRAFAAAAPLYNNALRRSGYQEEIVYIEDRKAGHSQRRPNRQRKTTWFNPPFSKNVKTNIGRKFLQLIDRHFPKGSKLSKIFNRNTVKVSYSCLPNVGAIIKGHNSRLCNEADDAASKQCNCRRPAECPLEGACLTSDLVYQATVKTTGAATNSEMHYIGSTATTFKLRYGNHKASFTHANKANQTELSKHVWELKRKKTDFQVTWKILQRAPSYTNKAKRCQLCLTEKLLIARADKSTLLNKRSELSSTCRHRNKYCLLNFVKS